MTNPGSRGIMAPHQEKEEPRRPSESRREGSAPEQVLESPAALADAGRSLADFVDWLHLAPAGTKIEISALASQLTNLVTSRSEVPGPSASPAKSRATWKERIWTCPPQTRLGISELAEAIGKSTSWIYKRTGPSATDDKIPCRRLSGELVFLADEIRTWISEVESIVNALPPSVAGRHPTLQVRTKR